MLSTLTGVIDTYLQANVFASNRYQRGNYIGLCELVNTDNGTEPMAVSNTGEGTTAVIDDNYTFNLYHRYISSSYADSEAESFGSGTNGIIDSATMRLVIVADRERLEHPLDEIVQSVVYGLPIKYADADYTDYDYIRSVHLTANNSELDAYADEYGSEGQLPPNYVIAAIDYTLEISINKNCYTLCN